MTPPASSSAPQFDLAIVGASFAGLVAARHAAQKGLRVAVLDAKKTPGAHVHTTGILVAEAAAEDPPPDRFVRRIEGVRLYAPSLRYTDLTSPGYAFYATDTPAYLDWLGEEAAKAGAELMLGRAFDNAERTATGFRLAPHGIEARYLLGADGAKSRVAECFGLGRNRRFLVGLEVEYDRLGGLDDRFLHTFVDRRYAPGYIGWVVPGAGVVQVGLACKRADKPNLARFEERLTALFDFSGARVVQRRSGLIPCGGVVRPVSAPGVLLVGDAAGMVSPLTAGGIYTAFHYGRAAADAIADHLTAGAPDPGAVLPATYPRFFVKQWLRRIMDAGPPNWLMNAMIGTRPMQGLARLVYFHSKGLKSEGALRDLVRGRER